MRGMGKRENRKEMGGGGRIGKGWREGGESNVGICGGRIGIAVKRWCQICRTQAPVLC